MFRTASKHANCTSSLLYENVHHTHTMSLQFFNIFKVEKCLRTYEKLRRKYVNTAEIISKVTMTLSLINSDSDFDFVGRVIKTPCLFYFRSVRSHYVEATHVMLVAFRGW